MTVLSVRLDEQIYNRVIALFFILIVDSVDSDDEDDISTASEV